MHKVALILTGGFGQRFWPLSRKNKPKQFLKLFTTNSMIRETFLRIKNILTPKDIFIVTIKEFIKDIHQEIPELPKKNYIIEPYPRDTLAAISLSSIYIEKRYENTILLICPSDHYIKPIDTFKKNIIDGFKLVQKNNYLLCFGIKPNYPETSYGYIEIKNNLNTENKSIKIYKVNRFREKPTHDEAVNYLLTKKFLWNSGIFIWKIKNFWEELSLNTPYFYKKILLIKNKIGKINEKKIIINIFEHLNKISIDYELLEKTKKLICLEADFIWNDLGSWSSINKFHKKDNNQNILIGNIKELNVNNSIIYGDDIFIAALGIKSLIIVKSKNILLICHKNEEKNIKKYLENLNKNKTFKKFL